VGLLFKTSALLLGLPTALALGYEAFRVKRWRVLIDAGARVGGAAFVIAGWWHIRNQILYGDWTANKAILAFIGEVAPEERFALFPQHLHSFALGLLGKFGVGHGAILFPEYLYWAAGVIALVGLSGALWRGWQALRLLLPSWSWARLRQLICVWPVALWLMHIALIAAVAASVLAFMLTVNGGWIGRYMFPAFISLGCVGAAGFLAWIKSPRWQAGVAAGLIGAQGLLAGYALFGLMLPAYSPPPVPTPAELQQMTPLDADIEKAARVLGYVIDPPSVKPGGVLAVTVYWQVTAQTKQPYTVFVHLFDPHYGSLAQRDTYPGLGNYPTQNWEVGRMFVDTYRIYLPADAPPTDKATILLGLYEAVSQERLPVVGADAGTDTERWVAFGRVSIQP
jgi:hypothetical protein